MYQTPPAFHEQRQVRAYATLWLLWATLSSLGAAVGTLLNALQPLAGLEVATPALGLSLGQWLVLRRQLRLSAWWVVLSAAAWGLGLLALLLLFGAHLPGGLPSLTLALGALVGLLQAWLLRRGLSQAWGWVLASGLAAAVGALAQRWLVAWLHNAGYEVGVALPWLGFWTAYAIVSGAGLLLLPGRWPAPTIGQAAQPR